MARFKYVGDPNDRFSGPDVAVHFGHTFRKNEVAEIPEKGDDGKPNPTVAKLRGHSHFVDMSDKDEVGEVERRKKAQEKLEEDRAKAAEAQRKADEKDEADRAKRAAASPNPSPAATAPRPPGNVTREPATDPFGGRPVEERTRAEDHTSAGKTKS